MELPVELINNKENIVRRLLNWFDTNQRSFPWRETTDAFEILLAEKLLQQTKARDSLVEIYKTLLDKYPSVDALAKAELVDLQEIVKPLGLVYRAQELKTMAGEIVALHQSKVPSDSNQLLAIAGIGEYCTRAVLSFAFMQRIAIVDTNVARWLHRLCGIDQTLPANPARKQYLYDLTNALLPRERVRDFNLAILDLCALVCKTRRPECSVCPVQDYCAYGRTAKESERDMSK